MNGTTQFLGQMISLYLVVTGIGFFVSKDYYLKMLADSKDPTVDFAVLECARGGILRRGLGFRSSDYSIVLNVAEDHLGLADVETLEDLARVKRVVVDVVRPSGWAILNADDELVVEMREHCAGRTAFFSMNDDNEIIRQSIRRGRISCVCENGWITILRGEWKLRVPRPRRCR